MEEQNNKFKIEKGFQFKIEIKGLDMQKEYNVVLFSSKLNIAISADIFTKENNTEVLVAVWGAEKTIEMPISMYSLEIYDNLKEIIYELDNFAYTSENSISKE